MESKEQLLELYEAHGDPEEFAAAKRLYEWVLAEGGAADPDVLVGYGYLLDCHGRISLREAAAQYQRAVALDPDADRPRYQLISAKAALGEVVDNMGPVYLSAFLLERLGRLEEAATAWQSILDWCEEHDAPLTAEWPERELARLRARLSGG
jgi:tetratricopeptide (TPR) repeat protein